MQDRDFNRGGPYFHRDYDAMTEFASVASRDWRLHRWVVRSRATGAGQSPNNEMELAGLSALQPESPAVGSR